MSLRNLLITTLALMTLQTGAHRVYHGGYGEWYYGGDSQACRSFFNEAIDLNADVDLQGTTNSYFNFGWNWFAVQDNRCEQLANIFNTCANVTNLGFNISTLYGGYDPCFVRVFSGEDMLERRNNFGRNERRDLGGSFKHITDVLFKTSNNNTKICILSQSTFTDATGAVNVTRLQQLANSIITNSSILQTILANLQTCQMPSDFNILTYMECVNKNCTSFGFYPFY